MNGWRPLAMNEANENVVFHSLMNLRCKSYIGLMLQLAQSLVEETLVALFHIKFFNCNLLADNIVIIIR